MVDFRVDPAHLDHVVAEIVRFDTTFETALDDADKRVNQLHASWSGDAADRQRAAHEEWKRGAEKMREALATMREIAKTASGNYTDAAAANAKMWEHLR
ncbi:WXG100 family type VII secretion target [Actinokineospora inagensis]|uniref:WXG100 family type VII secretion target n=1 Tax=Actinokineospora inagensis TaxID=103730 RepID=UPI00040C4881|nr:WXG100 family type VII secretion target [Actinokineospora inagensis]